LPALVNRDYRDLFAEFNAQKVEFLVVGAYALAVHGHVRATKDLDVWVRATKDNAERVYRAVKAFGAAAEKLSAEDFAQPGTIVQLGIAPTRIDILTRVAGLEFEAAWANRIEASYGDQKVFVISRGDLIASKRAAARPQDLVDLSSLEEPEDNETA
jgi:hypothetical protein